MVRGHRIEKTEDVESFLERIENYTEESIECTPYTFFRLSEKQRGLFKCEDLKRFLLEKRPVLVGIQYNGYFAVFYEYKGQKHIRIILDIQPTRIYIITFYIVEQYQIPQIRK